MARLKRLLPGHEIARTDELKLGVFREIWGMQKVLVAFDLGQGDRPDNTGDCRRLYGEMCRWVEDINRPGFYRSLSHERPRVDVIPQPGGVGLARTIMRYEVCFWFSEPEVAFEFKMRWA